MSRKDRLQQLLRNPNIWCPGSGGKAQHRYVASGAAELDARLGGGWPLGALTEILASSRGIGELRFLMPALRQLCAPATGRLAWIAPPNIPYAPALTQYGLDVRNMLIIQSANTADSLWAMEQVLRSSMYVAVFGWFAALDELFVRRLQLAAEAGDCWAVIFRHSRFSQILSPAPLRIRLNAAEREIRLDILRNRFGASGQVRLSW